MKSQGRIDSTAPGRPEFAEHRVLRRRRRGKQDQRPVLRPRSSAAVPQRLRRTQQRRHRLGRVRTAADFHRRPIRQGRCEVLRRDHCAGTHRPDPQGRRLERLLTISGNHISAGQSPSRPKRLLALYNIPLLQLRWMWLRRATRTVFHQTSPSTSPPNAWLILRDRRMHDPYDRLLSSG